MEIAFWIYVGLAYGIVGFFYFIAVAEFDFRDFIIFLFAPVIVAFTIGWLLGVELLKLFKR
jgi:hypothetical protein